MDSDIEFAENTGRILSISSNSPDSGVKIIDHIERRQCRIDTSTTAIPKEIPTEEFDFPVDRGFSIHTKSILIPHTIGLYIRNHAGFMIEELTKGDTQRLPSDEYSIEISAPIKLYIKVKSKLDLVVTSDDAKISFNGPNEVYIGVRSHHERPAAKIKITPDEEEMMQAVSYLGSSLQTISCERSYPTLRGHPPEIEISRKKHIPDVVEKPKTGVTVEVPKDYRSIYCVAPLVYYLGADLRPGDEYRIITNNGFVQNLDNTDIGFERRIGQILKQCFFLDCITRTEGYYQIDLHERNEIENKIGIDVRSLYGDSLSKKLEKYLSIPFDAIESYIPQWKLSAHIETDPNYIEIVPFLVNDLAIIRSAKETIIQRSGRESLGGDFVYKPGEGSNNNVATRGSMHKNISINGSKSRGTKKDIVDSPEFIEIGETGALEQAWVGDGIPIEASKAMIEAFKNRFQRNPTDEDIEITVVVNDDAMVKEGNIVDHVYNSRDELSFSVKLHQQLKIEDLKDVLNRDTDFLHYIGHIDDDGFECVDGQLDVTNMDYTGINSFLLNACSSYMQAIGLIEMGAAAGIATLRPVLDSGAERIGRAIARLLNLGFPFISALKIAKTESIMGDNYVLIGDGGLDLTQSKSGIPSLCKISKNSEENDVSYWTYANRRKDLGSITIPYVKGNQKYFLTSGHTGRFMMGNDELLEFLSMGEMPIIMDSSLYWSNENDFVEELINKD